MFKIPVTWIILTVVVILAAITGFAIGNPDLAHFIAKIVIEIFWRCLLVVLAIKFLYFLLDAITGA